MHLKAFLNEKAGDINRLTTSENKMYWKAGELDKITAQIITGLKALIIYSSYIFVR